MALFLFIFRHINPFLLQYVLNIGIMSFEENCEMKKKYIVVLGDGMADRETTTHPLTPLETANKPHIDNLAKKSQFGLVKTVPDGIKPGSDICNMAVLGIDSSIYTGRSPLEALSLNIHLQNTDVAIRTNLVTLSSSDLDTATMVDYAAGEITTEEAKVLVDSLKDIFGEGFKLFSGTAYRHCLVANNGSTKTIFTPPHDITSKEVKSYLPQGENADIYLDFIKKSNEILKNHPVNISRIERGLNPATHVWFWGLGTKPDIPDFYEKTGLKGAMISAVDLLKGIAIGANMASFDVEGATGTINTNWQAKVDKALNLLDNDFDYVYIHLEAPDEAGHHGSFDEKVAAIEMVDKVVGRVVEGLEGKYDFVLALLPDHATPVDIMTHTSEAVPYLIYRSFCPSVGIPRYDESTAKQGKFLGKGTDIIKEMMA